MNSYMAYVNPSNFQYDFNTLSIEDWEDYRLQFVGVNFNFPLNEIVSQSVQNDI